VILDVNDGNRTDGTLPDSDATCEESRIRDSGFGRNRKRRRQNAAVLNVGNGGVKDRQCIMKPPKAPLL